MNVVVKSYFRQCDRIIRRGVADNGDRAADRLLSGVVDAIQTPGSYSPPVHSAPGDPPFKISGTLAKSYHVQRDRRALAWRLGSDWVVSRYLELGTGVFSTAPWPPTMRRHMAPRPHVRPAIMRHRGDLATLFGTPV